jgi:hypothetical protein
MLPLQARLLWPRQAASWRCSQTNHWLLSRSQQLLLQAHVRLMLCRVSSRLRRATCSSHSSSPPQKQCLQQLLQLAAQVLQAHMAARELLVLLLLRPAHAA